jgi:hypothetical protein
MGRKGLSIYKLGLTKSKSLVDSSLRGGLLLRVMQNNAYMDCWDKHIKDFGGV